MTSLIDPGERDLAMAAETQPDKLTMLSVENVDQLSLSEALLLAYLEATDECLKIEDPQPSMMKGIASVWGMGGLFGPHIAINPHCAEEDVSESLNAIWNNIGRYRWTAIDDRQRSKWLVR